MEGWMLHARPQDLQRRKHILPRFEALRSEKEARLLLPLSCRGPSLRAARGLGPTYGPHNNRCGGRRREREERPDESGGTPWLSTQRRQRQVAHFTNT